jgi:hypothetical protein
MPKYMTHKEALERVEKWLIDRALREGYRNVRSIRGELPGVGVPDVAVEKRGILSKYCDICEVKTDEEDLKKAQFQLNNAARVIEKQGYEVTRWLAVTADLYGDLQNKGTWSSYEDVFAKDGIGILRVFRTKVEVIRKA